MTARFLDQAIERAGLGPVLEARRRGDLSAVKEHLAALGEVDLLCLGAVADLVRTEEAGRAVRVHPTASPEVVWMKRTETELDLLRAVALARVTTDRGARIGVDWAEHGLELAQVALGFGATDLTGPITKKSGALIHEDDLKKVKGKGMVAVAALKRQEISALIRNAGREPEFVDEAQEATGPSKMGETAHA